jgi:hypothetical protein
MMIPAELVILAFSDAAVLSAFSRFFSKNWTRVTKLSILDGSGNLQGKLKSVLEAPLSSVGPSAHNRAKTRGTPCSNQSFAFRATALRHFRLLIAESTRLASNTSRIAPMTSSKRSRWARNEVFNVSPRFCKSDKSWDCFHPFVSSQ